MHLTEFEMTLKNTTDADDTEVDKTSLDNKITSTIKDGWEMFSCAVWDADNSAQTHLI